MRKRFDYRLIRQMLIFAAVCEEEGIRGAARRLSISQPPLSAQLDELEDRLGVKLLERTRRGTKPTAEGLALLPEIERFIDETETLEAAARQLKAGEWGLLSIGAVHEAMLSWVPLLREALLKERPGLALSAREVDSGDIDRELERNPAALMFGHLPTLKESPSRKHLLVGLEKPAVVVPRSHHLSACGAVRLSDLADEDWVFPGRDVSASYVDKLVETCMAKGFAPRIRHEVSSTMQQIAYACCGQGLAMVPEFFVQMLPSAAASLELTDVDPMISLSLVWDPRCESPARDLAIEVAKRISVERGLPPVAA